jgi:hypothetical protein
MPFRRAPIGFSSPPPSVFNLDNHLTHRRVGPRCDTIREPVSYTPYPGRQPRRASPEVRGGLHQLVRLHLLAVQWRAMGLEDISLAAQTHQLAPAVTMGMPGGTDMPPPTRPGYAQGPGGQTCPVGLMCRRRSRGKIMRGGGA